MSDSQGNQRIMLPEIVEHSKIGYPTSKQERIDQVVQSRLNFVLLYKLTSIMQFYAGTFSEMGVDPTVSATVRE